MTIAITGATGSLGRAAIAALLGQGVAPNDVVAVVRNEQKAQDLAVLSVQIRVADYEDPTALEKAFSGIDRLLFISSNEPGEKRISQHTNVINAAKKSRVGTVFYTSLINIDHPGFLLAHDHLITEQLLADSGLNYVLLRNGWYWENYLADLSGILERGVIVEAAHDGKISGAARQDYAQGAAAVLTLTEPKPLYTFGGNQPLTLSDIADTISSVSGTKVSYHNVSEEELVNIYLSAGLPEPVAKIFANASYVSASGGLETTSTDLADVLGHPATAFADVVSQALSH